MHDTTSFLASVVMDSLSAHWLAIIVVIGSLILYSLQKIRSKNWKGKGTHAPPEPSGAWPVIGHLHLLGGEFPVARTLGALADKYGPLYSLRLGSHRALVVSSWEGVRDCLGVNDAVFLTRPSMAIGKYLGYGNAMFATAPYGPYWRQVRKTVTLELLTSHRLEKLKHVRASEVQSLVKELHLRCGTEVGMDEWFDHLTFNIIVRMLVGKGSPAAGCSEDLRFKKAIKRALYLGGAFVVSDVIPWLEWADIGGHLKAMKQTYKEIDTVIQRWLQEHIRKRQDGTGGDGEADFMDVMLSTLQEDTPMSAHERDNIIKATTLILIMTGSESTAETMVWALSALLNKREVLKRAQSELDAHVGRARWVEESDIKNLAYLQAIVKETLRLYPPGPLSGPREAMEDCYVSGCHVPKGTRLIFNLWKLHRDPRVWASPGDFQPERFLTTHADVNAKGQHFEYVPFSSGRRMCPALNFGLQVVHLALATLLQGFHITTPMDAPVDMREGVGLSLPRLTPLRVVLNPRLPSQFYN